jgi:hypothetical protein
MLVLYHGSGITGIMGRNGNSPEVGYVKISLIKTAFTASMLLSITITSRADGPRLFDQREFNCADFAQSVNYYVDLGETAATADFAMRESGHEKYDRRGFDLTERICMLCRVLYEPKAAQPLRDAMIGALGLPYMSIQASKWPLFPIATSGKTYFVLSEGRNLVGLAEPLTAYLKYCAEAGRFRITKLKVPTRAEAIDDANHLHSSETWKSLKWKWQGSPGNSYALSEDRTWEYIVRQANAIPVPPSHPKTDTNDKKQ